MHFFILALNQNREMANQGTTGKLDRSFGLKMAIIMVMSSIIGSGVFKKVAPMAELLMVPWLVVLAWLLAGIIILFGVFCIAELSALFPDAGGPFSWLERLYGKPISFLYGWSSFTVIQTAAISSIAFVFAGALGSFIDLPRLSPAWESISFLGIRPLDNLGAKIVSCALIIALTLVNILGTRRGGSLSLVFTGIILVSILAISFGAYSSTVGSPETFARPSVSYPQGGWSLFGFLGVMVLAMRAAFWGYEGWLALGFIGEEIQNPRRNLPRALVIGISIIILLYLVVNGAYLYVMPIDEMLAAVAQDENHIAAVLVVDKILGTGGAYVISAMILVSTFGCTNATILVSSRIYYAMARKGLFFSRAAWTHPRHRTPHYALIYQCLWACILVFSGSFDLLTDLVIIAAFVFNALIVFGVILLRKRSPEIPRPYKVPFYPWIPLIFVLFCILLTSMSFYESPEKSLMGILLIVSGLPFYFFWRKRGSR